MFLNIVFYISCLYNYQSTWYSLTVAFVTLFILLGVSFVMLMKILDSTQKDINSKVNKNLYSSLLHFTVLMIIVILIDVLNPFIDGLFDSKIGPTQILTIKPPSFDQLDQECDSITDPSKNIFRVVVVLFNHLNLLKYYLAYIILSMKAENNLIQTILNNVVIDKSAADQLLLDEDMLRDSVP